MANLNLRIQGPIAADAQTMADRVRMQIGDAVTYLSSEEADRLAVDLQRAAQQLRMIKATAAEYTSALAKAMPA